MTSRRRAEVGTPPTARLRPVSTVSPVAGPTTEIAAEPLPLSTLKLTSLLDDAARLHPLGAAFPDGSKATDVSAVAFGLVATACFTGRFPLARFLARRSCLRRRARRRAWSARLRFIRARYWRHQRLEYFLYLFCFLYFFEWRGPASAESVPNGMIVPIPINKASVNAIALNSIFPPNYRTVSLTTSSTVVTPSLNLQRPDSRSVIMPSSMAFLLSSIELAPIMINSRSSSVTSITS